MANVRKRTREELEKIRKRWLAYLAVSFATAFFIIGGTKLFFKSQELALFRQYCRSLSKGQRFEEVRDKAQELGFLVELDTDPIGHPEDPVYVIRPSHTWSVFSGCKLNVRDGLIYPNL